MIFVDTSFTLSLREGDRIALISLEEVLESRTPEMIQIEKDFIDTINKRYGAYYKKEAKKIVDELHERFRWGDLEEDDQFSLMQTMKRIFIEVIERKKLKQTRNKRTLGLENGGPKNLNRESNDKQNC